MRNANEYDGGPLFKQLDAEQEQGFRQWARDNWKPGDAINPVWHTIVRDEIGAIQEEHLKLQVSHSMRRRFDALTAIDETELEEEERGAGRTQLITRDDDGFDSIAWAFSEHVKEPDNPAFNSAVLYGNDDAPVRIDFYTQSSPEVTDKIARIWRVPRCCTDPRCGLPSDHEGKCEEEKDDD